MNMGSVRRGHLLLILVLLLVVLLLGYAWRHVSVTYFPVKTVNVKASFQHVDRKQLKQRITPFVTQGFFNVDSQALAQSVLNLPWVAKVTVKRLWPGTVVVDIDEQQAMAVWNETHLLNQQGLVFSPSVATFPKGLPRLVGPHDQAQMALDFLKTANAKLQALHLSVSNLRLDARHAFKLRLNNGIKLMLGRADLEARLQRFVASYPQVFAGKARRVEYVNLCYAHRMAVKWKQ